jgi:ABC-2 type transport system ATP-binding protein
MGKRGTMSATASVDGLVQPATGEFVIECSDVAKQYDEEHGIRGLDFTVPEGHVLGLIGPSGSGKTTTVRLLAGLLRRDSGSITVMGEDPEHFDAKMRRKLGYLPQSTLLYPTLPLAENLEFVASMYGFIRRERKEATARVLGLVDLSDNADMRLSSASGGMRRRLGLAAALLHDPVIVFMDEPTAGLDPILRRSLWEHFNAMRDLGKTLIVTTQYVGEAAYCDTIMLLDEGSIIAAGTPERLRKDAFGGELLDVTFTNATSPSLISSMESIEGVREVTATGSRSVRLVVEDAGTTIPAISAMVESTEVGVAEAERFVPEFDDVFVELVDRRRSTS